MFNIFSKLKSIPTLINPFNSPWETGSFGSKPNNQQNNQQKGQQGGKANEVSGSSNGSSSGGSQRGSNQQKQDSNDKNKDKNQQKSQEKPEFKSPFENNNFTSNKSNSSGPSISNNVKNNSNKKPDSSTKLAFDWLNKFFDGGFRDKNQNKNSDGSNRQFQNSNQNISKSAFGLIPLAIILTWLSFGFFKVDTDQNAVLLYFGKFSKIAQPGLNYHIPYPFGQVIKKSVSAVNTEEFGFSSESRSKVLQDFDAESLMLTGDENIVDVQFQVQWQISDIKNFVFNVAHPEDSIRKSAESAMREVIAKTPIAEALSDGKQKIEQQAKNLLQEILDSYQSGVRVVLVQLRRVDPPKQVIDAFRDVQTAKADKEREINEAQAYANDVIPRARGSAAQMKEDSEAYASQVVSNAEGEAARFLAVHAQYSKAKQVTKRRIYLETMEQIYRDMDKIYIDKGAPNAFIGQLPGFNSNPNSSLNSNKSPSSAAPVIVKRPKQD